MMFHIIEEIHYYIEETRFVLRKAMRGMIYLEKLFEIIFLNYIERKCSFRARLKKGFGNI